MPVLVPHLIWEVLLLALVVLVAVTASTRVSLFAGSGIWWGVGFVGLLATGLALSMRTGTPNLAVGGLAGLTGALYVTYVNDLGIPLVLAAPAALVSVLLVGLLLAVVVGLTSMPGWLVTLAGLPLALGLTFILVGPSGGRLTEQLPAFFIHPYSWLGLFVALSLAGGALFAVPPVRRLFGPDRAGDPVRFRGRRLLSAVVGIGGSSVLAGLAGLAQTAQISGAFPDVELFALLAALAAVLVGGVSGFGGRGGIAGTVLGVALVAFTIRWVDAERAEFVRADLWLSLGGGWLVVGLILLVGVVVGRLLEAIAPLPPAAPPAPPAPVGVLLPPRGGAAPAPPGGPAAAGVPPPAAAGVPPPAAAGVPPPAAASTEPAPAAASTEPSSAVSGDQPAGEAATGGVEPDAGESPRS